MAHGNERHHVSIVENRKAFHDYFIEERFEAGLALQGWEVKSLREGRVTWQRGALERADGGVVVLPMAETTAQTLLPERRVAAIRSA